MSLKNYVVAIPSYKRPETLRDRTMKVLRKYKVDPQKIHIFVADKDQKKIYEEAISNKSYNKIIIGKPGIKNIRNFMPKYFPQGQHIFYMDDDIYGVNECKNKNNINNRKDNKLVPLRSLKDLIKKGFKMSENTGLTNWGVYPVFNPFFMKPTTKNVNDYVGTKLGYVIGFMTGVINDKKAEIRTIDDKEDYERSIKYYLKDGGLLRFNNITCETKCYKEPGGMQVERTKKRIHDSAVYLTKKYPKLCTLNTGKKSGFTEVRMYDKRTNKPVLMLNNKGRIRTNKNNNKN
jgi:hypothetical protein